MTKRIVITVKDEGIGQGILVESGGFDPLQLMGILEITKVQVMEQIIKPKGGTGIYREK